MEIEIEGEKNWASSLKGTSEAYAGIGCETQRGFMKWSRTSYDSKKEHSRTRENEKGIQNPQV